MDTKNKILYEDMCETLDGHREVTLMGKGNDFYLHISFECITPLACDKMGYEIKRYEKYQDLLNEYNINQDNIGEYVVEMY